MIDQLFEVMKFQPGSGMVPSILLLLIWVNVRSLKKVLTRLEEQHDARIGTLEVKSENHEKRIITLETQP